MSITISVAFGGMCEAISDLLPLLYIQFGLYMVDTYN